MKIPRKLARGFTLIELMATLAILAVLLLVATPSMVAYKRNSELTSATNTLFSAINVARGEAIKRGTNALVMPVNNGPDWDAGWIVFIYKYASGRTTGYTYDAAYDTVILSQGPMPSYIDVTGNNNAGGTSPYIMFDASGYAKTNGTGLKNSTLSLARNDVSGTAAINAETRRIVISISGRVRTCNPSTDSSCVVSATN